MASQANFVPGFSPITLMYARSLEGRLLAGAAGDAINYFRQSIAPALREQAGFLSGRFLNDPASGQCLLVLVWESEADRAGADQNGYLQTLLGQLALYFEPGPQRRSYELSVQIV